MKDQIIILIALAHYMYIVGASTLIPDYLYGRITAHWLIQYVLIGYVTLWVLISVFIYLMKKEKL